MLFLKGLEIYGKSWKKISDIVKTRTVVQIRTHAQKYLIKLEKAKKVGITTGHGLLMMDGKAVTSLPPTQPQQLPKVRPLFRVRVCLCSAARSSSVGADTTLFTCAAL